jgi:5-methyltetrahydrofolate--homocysteine methyltransferase
MAALTAISALGVDGMGLNCATGPDSMREHLRQLAAYLPVTSAMPNAGLPEITPDGAVYSLGPEELAGALDEFTAELGIAIVGGCCGTTPAHMRAVVGRVGGRELDRRAVAPRPAAGTVSSLFTAVPLTQRASYLAVGERANAQGSKAFREALEAGNLDRCVQIARDQARNGAHAIDLSVDLVGRDGTSDMAELAARIATASTLPVMVDSTEPAVIQAALEHLGGKSIVNSVNFADGGERLRALLPVIREHGAAVVALTIDEDGQARTAERKIAVAERLIGALTQGGVDVRDVIVDPLTFPIAAGEETRRDGAETLAAVREIRQAHPGVHLMLGISNISFGLAPAARVALNSVFLAEAMAAGVDVAIVPVARIAPLDRIDPVLRQAATALVHGRDDGDGLARLLAAGEEAGSAESDGGTPAAVEDRLTARITQGQVAGLEEDLAEALASHSPTEVLDHLLAAMAQVGEAFGAGRMQLPFVLQAAEAMKAAVGLLEPHLERRGTDRGTVVLATVRGDVHDIGKNLVGIILANNGYRVVDIGIKQPLSAMLAAAAEHGAVAIGMSGLLVESVKAMKENLAEMNARGRLLPVILGGAALTRTYVDCELRPMYRGEVRYAKDAFEALAILDEWRVGRAAGARAAGDQAGAVAGAAGAGRPSEVEHDRAGRADARATGHCSAGGKPGSAWNEGVVEAGVGGRRDRREGAPGEDRRDPADGGSWPVPAPPFRGSRVTGGIALSDCLTHLDQRALFSGRWGLRPAADDPRPAAEIIDAEGRPRLRHWLDVIRARGLFGAKVAYGFFDARSDGDDLVIEHRGRIHRLTFPRQRRPPYRALPDYFAPTGDVIGLQVVTVGPALAAAAAELHAEGRYRDYLELHSLGGQLAEALADFWHGRMRQMWGIAGGERYSFGYPACPDLTGRRMVAELTGADRIGVELTEAHLLVPEQSTDAMIVHRPDAVHFTVRPRGPGSGQDAGRRQE